MREDPGAGTAAPESNGSATIFLSLAGWILFLEYSAGTTQKLNTNNSSTASAAFGSQTEYIRVVGDANCHFVLGGSPTASATSALLPSGEIEMLKVSPGEKIAVFHGSSTNVYVTEMSA